MERQGHGKKMNTTCHRYIHFTDEQLKRMGELYLSGMTVERIGEMYGIYGSAVCLRLNHLGIPRRRKCPPNKMTIEQCREAKKLRDSGVEGRDIMARYGVSRSTLSEAFKRARA